MKSQSELPESVAESPWFWVMLFSLAGLAAVFTVGPKFDRREAGIEENFHARERALGREPFEKLTDDAAAGNKASTDAAAPTQSPPWKPIFTLGPIAAILLAIAVVGMLNVLRIQRRRLEALKTENDVSGHAKPPAAPTTGGA
jgi:hypothetical protein